MRRLALGRIEPGARGDMHQVQISGGVLGEKDELGAPRAAFLAARGDGRAVAKVERELEAGDGLRAFLDELFGKLQGAKEIIAVGDRQRGHKIGDRELCKRSDRHGPFTQRIGAMRMKMHEADAALDAA